MRRAIALASTTFMVLTLTTAVAAASTPLHLRPINVVHRVRGASTSTNWAGYASTGTTFKAVKGKWVEPAVNCSAAANGIVAFWVGLDGFTSSTVEQDGTIAICSSGVPSYYDWWEMYPTESVQIVAVINPGDSISGSVKLKGSTYVLKVTDATTPSASFTERQTCSGTCQRTSAEWISEAPCCVGSSVYPMPNFGTIKFKGASATSSAGHAGAINDPTWAANSITMINGSSQTKVSTSALNGAGNSFTNTWVRAS